MGIKATIYLEKLKQRIFPALSKTSVMKLVNNPRTPAGLKAYWRKKLQKM